MQDETLNSFALRCIQIYNHKRNIYDTGQSKHFGRMLYPTNIGVTTECFNNLIEHHGIEKILSDHTLFPLHKPLAYPFAELAIKERLSGQINHNNIYALNPYFTAMEDQLFSLQYCPKCFAEQIREYGHPWFKRLWCVPQMFSCNKHMCLLLPGNLTTLQNSCFEDNWSSEMVDEPNPYANWQVQLLDAALPIFSKALKKKLFQECAFRIKQANPNVNDQEFIEYLTNKYIQTYEEYLDLYPDNRNRRIKKLSCKFRCVLFDECEYTYFPTHAEYFGTVRLAFPHFQDFLVHLKSISVIRETEMKTPYELVSKYEKSVVITELGI